METISLTGAVLSKPRYTYPDGYQIKGMGGLGSDARDALRLASIQRHVTPTSIGRKRRPGKKAA